MKKKKIKRKLYSIEMFISSVSIVTFKTHCADFKKKENFFLKFKFSFNHLQFRF